jgi:hypothetical protein
MTLSLGTTLGPYRILSPLGAGGMGEVYRDRDPRLRRDVAFKALCAGLATVALMAGFCVADVAAGGEFVPVWGVHAGTPEKVALTAGAMLDYASSSCWMCFFDSHGPVLEFESGIGGGRVNLGYTWWNERSESGAQLAGMSLKASLLRTWGTPWAAEVDRTYAGVEAQIACLASMRAAAMWRTSGPHDFLLTWGVGFGY